MKTIHFFVTVFFAAFAFLSCEAQTKSDASAASSVSDKVEAYYFHFSSRCVTCKKVEAEAKNNIETIYPELFKTGKMTFTAYNLDESDAKAMAEKLGVSGQTLLLVKGNKKVNITNEGFMYAKTNPEKFKEVMKEKLDELMK